MAPSFFQNIQKDKSVFLKKYFNKLLMVLDNKMIRWSLISLFILGSVLVIFPPRTVWFRNWANHAEWLALGYLLIGLFFLTINKSKLMLVSMSCSALVSFYLNETTNAKISYSKQKDLPTLKVEHFNCEKGKINPDELFNAVLERQADVISLQHLSPVLASQLLFSLSKTHPYYISLPREDPFGMALYSKWPFTTSDTFQFGGINNLSVTVVPAESKDTLLIIASLLEQPTDAKGFERTEGHLEKISFEANRRQLPTICLGEFNTTGWSQEIQLFKQATNLSNSRMGAAIALPDGRLPLLNVPLDHIFYSSKLECVQFSPIRTASIEYIGIGGTYQVKQAPKRPNGLQ